MKTQLLVLLTLLICNLNFAQNTNKSIVPEKLISQSSVFIDPSFYPNINGIKEDESFGAKLNFIGKMNFNGLTRAMDSLASMVVDDNKIPSIQLLDYDFFDIYKPQKELPKQDLNDFKKQLKKTVFKTNFEEKDYESYFAGIGSYEEWFFNKDGLFEKKVLSWRPFYYGFFDHGDYDYKYSKVGFVSFTCNYGIADNSKKIYLGRVSYEFGIKAPYLAPMTNEECSEFYSENPYWSEFTKNELLNQIFQDALSKNFKVYNSADKQKRFNIAEVEKSMQIEKEFEYMGKDTTIVSARFIEDASSILFIEDWYLNKSNFTLEKKVVGLAPVFVDFSINDNLDELIKTRIIPFYLFYSDK